MVRMRPCNYNTKPLKNNCLAKTVNAVRRNLSTKGWLYFCCGTNLAFTNRQKCIFNQNVPFLIFFHYFYLLIIFYGLFYIFRFTVTFWLQIKPERVLYGSARAGMRACAEVLALLCAGHRVLRVRPQHYHELRLLLAPAGRATAGLRLLDAAAQQNGMAQRRRGRAALSHVRAVPGVVPVCVPRAERGRHEAVLRRRRAAALRDGELRLRRAALRLVCRHDSALAGRPLPVLNL